MGIIQINNNHNKNIKWRVFVNKHTMYDLTDLSELVAISDICISLYICVCVCVCVSVCLCQYESVS